MRAAPMRFCSRAICWHSQARETQRPLAETSSIKPEPPQMGHTLMTLQSVAHWAGAGRGVEPGGLCGKGVNAWNGDELLTSNVFVTLVHPLILLKASITHVVARFADAVVWRYLPMNQAVNQSANKAREDNRQAQSNAGAESAAIKAHGRSLEIIGL